MKDPEVKDRYIEFKNTWINPNKLKNFIFNRYDISISDMSSIIISTACKIFTGELVEKAWELMTKDKKEGPITPYYYRMAYLLTKEKFKGQLFKDKKHNPEIF